MRALVVAAAVTLLAALLAAPALAVVAGAAAGLSAPGASPSPGGSAAAPDGGAGIPTDYLADFHAAGAATGVSWAVLAGIYEVECDFGRSRLAGCLPGTANPFGAQGPGQFLPGTWRAGLDPHAVIPPGPPAPVGRGWASDGDGDGVADVFDPADAILSTARMLAADGAATDISAAVFAYNHSPTYVAEVLALARQYGGGPPTTGAVATVLSFAEAQIGLPYQWGGAGPGSWDCSGLVQAAAARAGLVLPHDAAAQYALTSSGRVPLGALEPGDLVFYGSSPATIHHVGIAVDASHMVDAPYTGVDVRIDPVAAGDLLVATRPFG